MTEIDQILRIMNEDAGMTSHLSGATSAQDAMGIMGSEQPPMADNHGYEHNDDTDSDCFTEQDYQLVKEFIQRLGSPERARALIDNYESCVDCMDLVSGDEGAVIDQIADMTPDDIDMPTGVGHGDLSQLYNPNAQAGGFAQ